MSTPSFVRVVVDRTEIAVIANQRGESAAMFDVYVNGQMRATVTLGLYHPPSIGVYGSDVAVWAGNRGVLGGMHETWLVVEFEEPIRIIYRLAAGWCVVTELGVTLVDEAGTTKSRSEHREVIVGSSWKDGALLLSDFSGEELIAKIDEAQLSVGDIVPNLV